MKIEILPADEAWAEARPLISSVWTPQRMATSAWRDVVTADARQRVLVRDRDGQLVSHIAIFLCEATWDGRRVRVGGIGGVCTKDGNRRQGFARAGMAEAARYMKTEMAVDCGLLFCSEANYRFYENCGWSRFTGDVFVEQPAGQMHFKIAAPYILALKTHSESGIIDLNGLPW